MAYCVVEVPAAFKSNEIKIVLSTAANTVKGMEGQKKSAILHHP